MKIKLQKKLEKVIKGIPDVLISGNSGFDGGISELLGMKLMEIMDTKNEKKEPKK